MTESICTQCGERFHDGACCCDPSAPPLPTLEFARQELLRLKPHVEKWKTADGREVRSRMANDLLALIDARIADLLLRESAQQDQGAARGKIAEREQC